MSARPSPTVQAVYSRTTLALTSDVAIESVLADIPFFCVGLVAFAFFAFMLVMKRVTLLSIYLYSTALFSFAAAILDLSQILARGSANLDRGTGITAGITALMNTREVGLSIAVGLRFLFFWAFVAERPRGEPPPTTDLNDPRAYALYAKNSHSAQWERWGYLGIFLKWTILAATLSIPVLQIIWRVAVRRFGVLYQVESTIEILVSALFILKVLLNVFLSPVSPWWKPFRFYVAPLLALLINLALGIGELVYFLFSETALGRFLQAIEVYTMIIFLLIVSFYKVPTRPNRSNMSVYDVDEKRREPTPSPPPVVVAISDSYDSYPTNAEPARSSNRLSVASRVSSWLFLPRRQSNIRGRFLQSPQDVESVAGTVEPEPIAVDISRRESPTLEQQDPQASTSAGPAPVSEGPPPFEPTQRNSFNPPDSAISFRGTDKRESRPSTGVSLYYYGVERGSRLSFPNPAFMGNDANSIQSSGTDSPVYGLEGIVNTRSKRRDSTGSLARSAHEQGSISSFEELIQQQAELDRSIAALRLFSPTSAAATFKESQAQRPPDTLTEQSPSQTNMTSSTINRTVSTVTSSSARSEFSLSIFPEPPTANLDVPTRTSFASMRAKRASRLSRRDFPSSFDTTGVPSLPTSPTRIVPGRLVGSNATQYDVTSFIGHLTGPGPSPERAHATGLSDVESETEIESPQSLNPSASVPRPLQLTADSVTADYSTQPEERVVRESPSIPQLRPFFLGNITTSPTVSSPLAGGARGASTTPVGPRKPARGRLALPAQPRLAISGPRQPPDDQAPGAFESPRPPPSFFVPLDSKFEDDDFS